MLLNQDEHKIPFEPYLMMCFLALLVVGLLMIVSSSLFMAAKNFTHAWFFSIKHIAHLLVGCCAFLFGYKFPIRYYSRFSWVLIFLAYFMLLIVLVPGLSPVINGAQRWLRLPGFMLQTSDVAKVAILLYVSSYFAKRFEQFGAIDSEDWLFMALLCFSSVILLLLQPDFGSAVVLVGMVFALLVLSSLPVSWILLSVVLVCFAGFFLVWFEPYRFARIVSFLDPWKHALGSGYQLTQALMAIGRGGLFGVGLGNGLQKIMYLPEAHTDFIFAVFCEELGIIAGLILLFIYYVIFIRMLYWSWICKKYDRFFSQYYLFGFAVWFSSQSAISIGVSIGFLPTKGLVLPLISYGGSAVVIFMYAWGVAFQCIKHVFSRR